MSRSKDDPQSANPRQDVATRLVLNFPGFEQTDSLAQLGRLRYGGELTAKLWGFDLSQGELEHVENSHSTAVEFAAKGANWSTATRLVQFRWNDIVHAYEKAGFPGGFLKNTAKYLAFFADGTVKRYRRASMRYWGFTIFPVLLVLLFAFAVWLGLWLASAPLWLHLLAIPLVTLALCKWPGDLLYLPLTIADWGFARDMVFQTNPQIEERFDEFARTLVTEIRASTHDEILVVGHSFGSLWAVSALSKALALEPGLMKNRKIRFLALGSSMLKIALAPGASFMRQHWQKVMDQPELFWHEVQTKDDLIAFYKCDPFKEVKINNPVAGYAITKIRFSKGMAKKRYRAMRKSFYRTHRQYILYYDKRVDFDYMMRLFGPFDARILAEGKSLTEHVDQKGLLV